MQNIDTIIDGITYKAWVADWKAEYKALSETIRTTKLRDKAASRQGNPNPYQSLRVTLAANATYMLAVRAQVKEAAATHRDAKMAKAA